MEGGTIPAPSSSSGTWPTRSLCTVTGRGSIRSWSAIRPSQLRRPATSRRSAGSICAPAKRASPKPADADVPQPSGGAGRERRWSAPASAAAAKITVIALGVGGGATSEARDRRPRVIRGGFSSKVREQPCGSTCGCARVLVAVRERAQPAKAKRSGSRRRLTRLISCAGYA
jgi:hypothetical protein